jgi:methylated-DNA-[protein]-cysteine S-methyltransferase
VGQLWTAGDLVLAHELDYGSDPAGEDPVVQLETEATFLDARPDPAATGAASGVAVDVVTRVLAFLGGEVVGFEDVRLDLDWCTDFQRAVLDVVRALARGEVAAYGEVAALAGSPGAGRAVGTVCARNRFALFVPCHRVVSATGIGTYGSAGLEVKRRLLALEGVSL